MIKKIKPVHPGEILLKEFLKPMKISAYKLAKDIDVPVTRIHEIIKKRRGITADTDLRLAIYFKMSKGFWLGLQKRYELDMAEDSLSRRLLREIHPYEAGLATA
ncbi:MAG: HigA family addiction module antidote protein [Gammaproteobacteria bacterium]|nr:HigA family addiction module antidote protein [Gammaproteobacteria bacterium]